MCVISTTAMRHARTLLVVLVSLALGLVGLGSPPAAQAAGWSLRGTVVAPGDGAVAGTVSAWVDYYGASRVAETEVGADGTFELTGLEGVSYWILFASAEPATAVSGWYKADDQTLLPRETSMLDGVRVSAGAPITLRPVAPSLVPGALRPPATWTGSSGHVTLTLHATASTGRTEESNVPVASDGSFQLALAPHLAYRLQLESGSGLVPGYWTSDGSTARTFAEGTEIDQSLTSLTLAPALTSTLHGRVELPPGYGSTITGLVVFAQTWNDDGEWGSGGAASVAADGSFSLGGLPTGHAVRLLFEDGHDRLLGGLVSATDGSTTATPDDALILVDGHEVVIRPLLLVSVRGKVEVPASYDWVAGRPFVELSDAETGGQVGSRGSLTEGDMSFDVGGLHPDREFLVRLSDTTYQLDQGYLADLATGTVTRDRDQAARIRGGGDELTLRPTMAPAISGRLVLPAGQVMAGERVTLRDSRIGGISVDDVAVDAEGRFRFLGLQADRSYSVQYVPASTSVVGGYYSSAQRFLTSAIGQATAVTPGQTGITLRARTSATMSGRVIMPTGYTSLEETTVLAIPDGGLDDVTTPRYGHVALDGTFQIAGLDPTQFYALHHSGPGLVTGYRGEDGAWESSWMRAAVLAPQSGVTLRPTISPRIIGRIELPTGVRWRDVDLDVHFGGASGFNLAADGTFVIPDLPPVRQGQLLLEDRRRVVAGGWYVSPNSPLTRDEALAPYVRAGATGIVLRPQRAAVVDGRIVMPDGVDPASVDVEVVASIETSAPPWGSRACGGGDEEVSVAGP
jgi:hypothetical protein